MCGCGRDTGSYFYTGHDGRAASMLHFLKWGTTDVAAILAKEDFGPTGTKNLEEVAIAQGWIGGQQ